MQTNGHDEVEKVNEKLLGMSQNNHDRNNSNKNDNDSQKNDSDNISSNNSSNKTDLY